MRLYSQETWQLVLGNTGKEEVAKCVDVVLEYYIAQSTAQNHLVKEVSGRFFICCSSALDCIILKLTKVILERRRFMQNSIVAFYELCQCSSGIVVLFQAACHCMAELLGKIDPVVCYFSTLFGEIAHLFRRCASYLWLCLSYYLSFRYLIYFWNSRLVYLQCNIWVLLK